MSGRAGSRRTGAANAEERFGPFRRAFYWAAWFLVLTYFVVVHRLRRINTTRVPREGPALLVANHASHLDPPILGLCVTTRRMRPVARESLFKNPVFGRLLRTLGCIPLRDNEGDIGAVRTALESLKRGEVVILFPEGSRSYDGELQPFKRGAALLLRRAKCPVVPVAIDGAFEAWPRTRKFPRVLSRRVRALVGEPIPHEELMRTGDDDALDRLRAEISRLRAELRASSR